MKILARALARLWIIVVFAAFSTPAGVAVASEGVAAREVVVTSAFSYDGPSIARIDEREMGAPEASPAQLSDMREESVSRSVEERDTSTTRVAPGVATEAASPWSLGPGPRGLAIEDALGGNLPAGFKTFDRFADGVATSIKSVDLSASSYQSAGALTSRLSGYVDSVAAFDNYSLSGFSLSSREISTRALEIAIQPGIGSSAQMAALNNVIAYGSSQGVVVRVVTVP